jgi:anhydro-N-acetylmuramic acid kinase
MSSNHTPPAQPIEKPQDKPHSYYIGLMSGTSMDGVDGVVVDLSGDQCRVIAHHSLPFSASLKTEMLALNTAGNNELHRSNLAANQLALLYAQVVAGLLYSVELDSSDITAIGAHGQTVRHCPSGSPSDGGGYTIQLNNPALLAERTGIDVVADFRRRDVAAGGQGAPLVPVFHQAVFGRSGHSMAVLNIGGIANVSLLYADRHDGGRVEGFDTGPGNVLMDAWTLEHTGMPYDAHGAWAASGVVSEPLLAVLLRDAYFAKPIPKSTGRDLFHWAWLQARLDMDAAFGALDPADVQATLTALTARSIADALHRQTDGSFGSVFVCGGGALNQELMRLLRAFLPNVQVQTTDVLGIPVMQVEAAAFAWLAKQCVERKALALDAITGAQGSRVLGAMYPA